MTFITIIMIVAFTSLLSVAKTASDYQTPIRHLAISIN